MSVSDSHRMMRLEARVAAIEEMIARQGAGAAAGIQDAIGALPPDRKRVAEYLYREGWTMQRIAGALGVGCTTINRDLEGLPALDKPPRPKGGRPRKMRITEAAMAELAALDRGQTNHREDP